MTVLTGLVYPFAVTGVAQVVFARQGRRVAGRGRRPEVGSELIGQAFVDEEGDALPSTSSPAPSAATTGPRPATTRRSASARTSGRRTPTCDEGRSPSGSVPYRELNGLGDDAPVPVDAVTASGSGLDPHISVANARLQARVSPRSAASPVQRVLALVDENTDGRFLGIIGEKGVNVLELNLALDRPLRRASP